MSATKLCLYQARERLALQAAEIMRGFGYQDIGLEGEALGDDVAQAAIMLVVSDGEFPSRFIRVMPNDEVADLQLQKRIFDAEKRRFIIPEPFLKAKMVIVLQRTKVSDLTHERLRRFRESLANACGWRDPNWIPRKKRRASSERYRDGSYRLGKPYALA